MGADADLLGSNFLRTKYKDSERSFCFASFIVSSKPSFKLWARLFESQSKLIGNVFILLVRNVNFKLTVKERFNLVKTERQKYF